VLISAPTRHPDAHGLQIKTRGFESGHRPALDRLLDGVNCAHDQQDPCQRDSKSEPGNAKVFLKASAPPLWKPAIPDSAVTKSPRKKAPAPVPAASSPLKTNSRSRPEQQSWIGSDAVKTVVCLSGNFVVIKSTYSRKHHAYQTVISH